MHLLLGPVGAGKTTLALRLARELPAVSLNLDAWMPVLFAPDRPEHEVLPWYVERVRRCGTQIGLVAREVVATGTDAILEIGLLRRVERAPFLAALAADGIEVTVHVLDAPREVRRARVEQRNVERGPTFSMVVPPAIFELASDAWEPPDDEELRGLDVRRTGA